MVLVVLVVLMVLVVLVVPGGFKKLREVCRKNFHLVAPSKTSVVTSYDQKTSELHDYLHHDYFHVSVDFQDISGQVPEQSGKIPYIPF